jgi:hypothetical protein
MWTTMMAQLIARNAEELANARHAVVRERHKNSLMNRRDGLHLKYHHATT